ncbi:hypothetical protein MTO96_028355 [Rhipicephalus appendiculatus]
MTTRRDAGAAEGNGPPSPRGRESKEEVRGHASSKVIGARWRDVAREPSDHRRHQPGRSALRETTSVKNPRGRPPSCIRSVRVLTTTSIADRSCGFGR